MAEPKIAIVAQKADPGVLDGEIEHQARNIDPGEGLQHKRPRLVMCPPENLSVRIANNVWMKGEKIDKERAMSQYRRIKNVMEALDREVLEITPVPNAQDQTYTANVAVAIEPYVVLANYKAHGRDIEIAPARAFFRKHDYETIQPPYHFEGEADLKRLHDDLYFGGYSQFTDIHALGWIADQCEVEIIPIRETNPKLYHLDCSILVVDEQNAIVIPEGIDRSSLEAIGKVVNIIEAPKEISITGCTNAVLIREKNICLSGAFNPEFKEYNKAMEWMNSTFDRFGFTCVFLDCDEADKSGADLSCMVMHLTF